jgi:hypothetical protein
LATQPSHLKKYEGIVNRLVTPPLKSPDFGGGWVGVKISHLANGNLFGNSKCSSKNTKKGVGNIIVTPPLQPPKFSEG